MELLGNEFIINRKQGWPPQIRDLADEGKPGLQGPYIDMLKVLTSGPVTKM
jgi:hypothetical protein